MNFDNIFSTGAQKLLFYPKRIEKWQMGQAIVPVTLEIQPSEQCSHNCPHCQSQYNLGVKEAKSRSKTGKFLDLSLLESIWTLPPEGVVISGNTGDPLLHPKIADLISIIHSKSIPTVVITNGQALNDDLNELIINDCLGIRISLDAFDSDSYSKMHGVKSSRWSEVITKITSLTNEKHCNKKSKCLVGLGFLTSEKSKKWMEPACKLAKSLGVDYIQFRPYHYDTSNVSEELITCKLYEDDHFKVLGSFQKYLRLGECSEGKSCQAAWFYTVLDARGDLYICCHNVGNDKAKVGTLTKDDWKTYINSDLRRESINEFTTTSCIPNCRLHTQNSLLLELRNQSALSEYPIKDTQITMHAPFL